MNISREVVTDLLPVYFSGEASADTRRLVEDYFHRDPDFERIARRAATPLETLRAAAPVAPDAEKEKFDLECVRREVDVRKWQFGLALFFTLAPLLVFIHSSPNGRLVWQMPREAPWVAGFDWGLAALFWFFYFARLRWRTASLLVVSFFTLAAAVLFPLYFVFAGWPRLGGNTAGMTMAILWIAAILAAIVGWVRSCGRSRRSRFRAPS